MKNLLLVMLATAGTLACRTPPAASARGATATALWSADTGADADAASGPGLGTDGTVYVGGSVDTKTGEIAWAPNGDSPRRPCLLAFDPDGRLRQKVLGKAPSGWTMLAPPLWVALAPWGTAYGVDRSGGLYAVFPNGETLFRQATLDGIAGPPAISPQGRLYVGGTGGLRGLDIQATGEPVALVVDLGRAQAYAPVASADGRVYFGSSSGGRLIAVEANGTTGWTRRASAGLISVDAEGNAVVAVEAVVTAYDAAGEPRWTFEARSALAQPVVGPDGTVYVCTRTGLVHAIDRLGKERWSFALDDARGSVPTLGPDGNLYATSTRGTLHALDPQGGKRFTLGLPPASGRVTVGGNGRLYSVGADRRLYAYAAP